MLLEISFARFSAIRSHEYSARSLFNASFMDSSRSGFLSSPVMAAASSAASGCTNTVVLSLSCSRNAPTSVAIDGIR